MQNEGNEKMENGVADHRMRLTFDSNSENESFARVTVAAFCARLDPTLEEMADIRTAVSEAVTNCIVHGYNGKEGTITIGCEIRGNDICVTVEDTGVGIENIAKAMEPLYTSKPELERSGMGFSFMEAFMDRLEVESQPGRGTSVVMHKKIVRGINV